MTQPNFESWGIQQGLVDALKEHLKFHVILLIGAPCSGKGTQSSILSSVLNIPAISTGDLFRAEVQTGSELGKKMKEYMDKGQLIPNEFTTSFLTLKLAEEKYQNGIILDGYPRDESHLEILIGILNNLDRTLSGAVYLDVPETTLRERVTSRLVCDTCQAVTSVVSVGSMAHKVEGCAGKFAHRKDDDISVFERRYQIFSQQTLKLLPILEKRNILVKIPPLESPELVAKQILTELIQLERKSQVISSYKWLEDRLGFLDNSPPEIQVDILKEFRDRALTENISHRTGILRRFVYLQTTNLRKFHEHTSIFESLYGIEVLRLPVGLNQKFMATLLRQKAPDLVPLAIIREESNLYRPNSNVFSSLQHGVRAVNRSTLTATSLISVPKTTPTSATNNTPTTSPSASSGNSTGSALTQSKSPTTSVSKTSDLIIRKYQHETVGRIDLTKRKAQISASGVLTQAEDPSVFGWDDIFVVNENGYTYHQLRQHGIKHSSRDMVISEFLKDVVHYKDMLSLAWTEIHTSRPIDFSVSLADLSHNNEYFNNELAIKYGYRHMVNNALKMGTFLRRAKNRRQNTYWCPGTNGGIPMVKKADKIHEETFRAHDIGHYMIPDLIFIGTNSVFHRRAYIAYRMISEATTMTLADMLFVDALKNSGVQYDFDKRRIYPLFRDLHIDLSVHETVANPEFLTKFKKIVHANYKYCLRGDDSVYRKILSEAGSSDASLVRFKEKFMPFFVEDFRWTEHNYDNMLHRSEELGRWWHDISPLRTIPGIFVESIDDFIQLLKSKDKEVFLQDEEKFVDQVFDIVFERNVRPVLVDSTPLPPKSTLLFRAFTRWLLGQLAITSKFHFLLESKNVREIIIDKILVHVGKDTFTLDHVNEIRNIYETYLKFLSNRNFISKDDEGTFAEVYPLFDPYYISYDKDLSQYEDLASVSRRVFSENTHQEKQLKMAEFIMSRTLKASERKFMMHMYQLVEFGGGQLLDGIFVTRPGVLLLSYMEAPDLPEKIGLVTFLISGISIETSLELVAHKEAAVARLTSSKTNAMNTPLFSVQGKDTAGQRVHLTELIRSHAQYELTWKPRESWNFQPEHGPLGTEIFNMTLPAAKSTCLCYSMTLADFHNLFIGRMGSNGNEFQVRHVVARMAEILHQKYPNSILNPSDYLKMKNSDKLSSFAQSTAPATLSDEIKLVGKTVLTPEASFLFHRMNINTSVPEYIQLSEFRSRITYLAYSESPESPESASEYITKIVNTHGHASILAGSQVIFSLPKEIHFTSSIHKFVKVISGKWFFVGSLKDLLVALKSTTFNDPNRGDVEKLREKASDLWPLLFPKSTCH